ncbi:NAD(P)H-hydrate epimerase [Microbacterium sp. CFH 31415]|uniref:NAD(P)H-hydrate epimerase n=1 Tax=Microbacterium sp. CFH 31415 TaxID=2921732 RepID=UPI001F130A3C|nr:NAD(P)H-hydrate epimerase [Microbacterium sp. CFH 31415]MCH6229847.1 NAD(P)H-hydrate epimerase [Microbacterium sp. CFH 31415]
MTVRVPAYTAAQVRAVERPLLDAGQPLMRRAATALAGVIGERLTDAAAPRVLVIAGSGDNGGDALYAASELGEGIEVDVLAVGSRVHEDGLAAALEAGARQVSVDEAVAAASGYTVVVDGILGIGTSPDPALRGAAREAVARLLAAMGDGMRRTVAVDLPSGLQPDTGVADDVVLPAAVTVTFGAVKAGLVIGRGPDLCGDLVLVDLGLEPGLADEEPAGEASVTRILEA